MKTPLSLKPLTLEAVWNTAEKLIFKNGKTTSTEVKKMLRRDQYYARQSEVDTALEFLAEEDNWTLEWQKDHWTYFFTEDTEECVHFYLERAGQFWEVALLDKTLYCSQGRLGQLGEHALKTCASNRYGFYLIRQMIKEKEALGYEHLEDVRPHWTKRLRYWHLLNDKPRQLQLYYQLDGGDVRSFCLRPQKVNCVDLLIGEMLNPLALTGQTLQVDSSNIHQDQIFKARLLYDNGYCLNVVRSELKDQADFWTSVRLLVS